MESSKMSITDIAKRTGISVSTVSRVLNHPELVNAQTAESIRSAMKELDYKPRTSKRSKEKKNIIINVSEVTNPFYSEIISGIVSSATTHSYYTLISQESLGDIQSVNSFVKFLKSIKACGVIFCSPLSSQFYDPIGSLMPVVQCCEYNSEEYSYVSIDDFQASYNVMEHIYSQGRRKIAFINGPLNYKYARERQRGYEAFLEQAGLSTMSNWSINLSKINYDMAFASACQLLTSLTPPDAVFASSDLIAAAVIKAAKLHRIRVPEDLIVVGFDNINISTICDPAITTVNQPCFQLGYTAGEILHEHIVSPTAYKQQVLLNTELIIRRSSSSHKSMEIEKTAV
ncbi:MAG: LacI family transcriptional regulator [Lachnospiraceae bacterium]|nr:LacI family transcriptional regulator [Lachnospiraceae bacterium]